jgi:catechol 2,3-dioxygenase-like lactoylglutathione lyase family enzyme
MALHKVVRGRLFDHLHLVVRDLPKTRRIYGAVLEVLGVPIGGEGPEFFWADELYVSTTAQTHGPLTGRVHLAFQANDRATVERAHAAAVAAGAQDNGGPGERPYHPGYYAAFVLDPDGNNLEIVFHGPAQRSAPAVELTF